MTDKEVKKKKGFFSRTFGRKSKEDKLAEAAALKLQQQVDLDQKMAEKMAAINAAALKSAREMDEQAGLIEPSEDLAEVEAREKQQAEAQAAHDVERAKQLAAEKKQAAKELAQRAEDDAKKKVELETQAQAAEQAKKDAASKAEAKAQKDKTKAIKLEQAKLEKEKLEAERIEKARQDKQAAEPKTDPVLRRDEREVGVETSLGAPAIMEETPQTVKSKPAKSKPEPVTASAPETKVKREGFLKRISKGLRKSTAQMSDNMSALFTKRKLDAEALEELEDLLIAADLGVGPAMRTTEILAKDKFDKQISPAEIKIALADVIGQTLQPLEKPLTLIGADPEILLFVGVNGSGKTTTLGKLAARYTAQGKKVLLCAGDTFRAAAVEQLKVWGERAGAPVVSAKLGADAAGLVFDAVQRAKDENYDILMIDTAGRLQNRTELMDELSKIVRVIEKQVEGAPHHSILVLDATVGQNAISQTKAFEQTAKVTGLIMTKLDGTAKGGVLVALADQFNLPIHAIGIGEHIDDLENFSASVFAAALSGVADAVMDDQLKIET